MFRRSGVAALLALAAVIGASAFVTAKASAEPIVNPGGPIDWSEEGEPLGAEATASLEGPLKFSYGSGSIECTLNATLVLEPGNVGHITGPAIAPGSGCKATGAIATICGGFEEATVEGPPWSATAVKREGSSKVSIGEVDLDLAFEGGPYCPGDLHVSGGMTATPDDSDGISSLSLSGTLSTTLGSTSVSGALAVDPAGEYGITATNVDWSEESYLSEVGQPLGHRATASLEGPLKFTYGSGSIECTLNATLVLEPGNVGHITEPAIAPGSGCKATGVIATICGGFEEAIIEGPPWRATAVKREGSSSVWIGEVDFDLAFEGTQYSGSYCPNGLVHVSGGMTATPDDSKGISSLSLSGTLSTTIANAPVSGTLAVDPPREYGITATSTHWSSEGGPLPAEETASLEGPLKFTYGSGSIECTLNAKLVLEPGNAGHITEPAIAPGSGCKATGTIATI
jgi:hypothetical protein